MAFTAEKLYICIFEFEGSPHVQAVRSAAGMATARQHMEWQHPGKKIIEFREAKSIQDVEDTAERIRSDPDWVPLAPDALTLKETTVVTPSDE